MRQTEGRGVVEILWGLGRLGQNMVRGWGGGYVAHLQIDGDREGSAITKIHDDSSRSAAPGSVEVTSC